jgi:hypothetical protein
MSSRIKALSMFAQMILFAMAIYLGAGILFALVFVTRLLAEVDPAAVEGPIGFRILILPGATLLWPVLLSKLLRSREESS